MNAGELLDLTIDKPAAGGRMIARHQGQVVFVAGAIPGERVKARVDKVGKGLAYATTIDVLEESPDRRILSCDAGCGGNLFAHIAYERQRQLKAEIVADAFARLARLPLSSPVPVMASPEREYRMRARLHVRGSRIGFYREGTHDLCDPAPTGQLMSDTVRWLERLSASLSDLGITSVAEFDVAENRDASERACHLLLSREASPAQLSQLANVGGLTGLSAERPGVPGLLGLFGAPWVHDRIRLADAARTVNGELPQRGAAPGAPSPETARAPSAEPQAPTHLVLRRDVRAFFQGNRYLLDTLVEQVTSRVETDDVVDLYAGVGLFGLSLAACGRRVTLVEGDRVSGGDLQVNAEPFGARARVRTAAVEDYLRTHHLARGATVVVDPPRTGLSRDAVSALLNQHPLAVVYVSCDVATLARDCRAATEAGYEVRDIEALDLFPNTPHVETIVTLVSR